MPKSNKIPGKKRNKIYLDHAASAFPNPSSIHESGVEARKKLETARREVAATLSSRKEEIIFTSGGTESNNLAIQGMVCAAGKQKFLPHIIITNIEHPSVLETCRMLESRKLAEITIVPVEANGIVDPRKIKKALRGNTVLVSVMYANNEIGTIQPVKEIAKEIRHYKKSKSHNLKAINYPFFHADAVQAVNYLDLNVEKLGVDMLSLSGSKIEGAGRVGVLFKKASVPLAPVFGGGDQEMGLRPGTEDTVAIIKFSAALKKTQSSREKESKRLIQLRHYFIRKLSQTLDAWEKVPDAPRLMINGDLENRLPNNINVTFSKIPSDLLVIELSARGIMASSKSACKSGDSGGSYVIKALRPDADPEIGGLRFSLGADTTKKDIDYTAKTLRLILTKLKKWYD